MALGDHTNLIVHYAGGPLAANLEHNLIEVRVEQGLNQPARCILRFVRTDLNDLPAYGQKPGGKVKVSAPKVKEPLFDGEVVAIEVELGSEPTPELTLIAYDPSLRLSATSKVQTYLQMTPADIVGKMAAEHGFSTEIDRTKGVIGYHLQASTDLELINLLATRTGYDWWAQGGKLFFKKLEAKGTSKHSVPATMLRRLSVRASANRPDEVEVRGWDSNNQMAITGTKAMAGMLSATGPLAEAITGRNWVNRPYVTSALPTQNEAECNQLAEAIMRRSLSSAVRAEGEGNELAVLRPGMALEVTDQSSLQGTFLLTEVKHRWAPGGPVTTSFIAGDRSPADAGALSGATASRSVDTYGGVLVGKVTNIKDEDKLGRVKVTFVGLTSQQESHWARVLIPGAGKARGSVALPEVGDEVLVGFESGDLRRPIVLGGLFTSKSAIPKWQVNSSGQVTARRTTSRKGHYMELGDDLDGEEHILLSLADEGSQIRLAKDRLHILVPANNPLTIEVGEQSKMEFDGKGKITIECMDFELKAKKGVKIEGVQVEAKASAQMKLDGGGMAELTSAKTTVKGSGMVEVSGAMVKIN
jgi:phage protein D